MLSLLPEFLSYRLLGEALLRVTAGFVFLYLAYVHFSKRRAVAEELSTLVGGAGMIIPIYSLLELLLAVSLIIGAWTQLSAIVGAIIAIKMLIVRKKLNALKPLSELSYVLLAVICISLIVSGAGAFAFDLPL